MMIEIDTEQIMLQRDGTIDFLIWLVLNILAFNKKMKYEVASDYAKLALDKVGETNKTTTKLGQMRTMDKRLKELCARFVSGNINVPAKILENNLVTNCIYAFFDSNFVLNIVDDFTILVNLSKIMEFKIIESKRGCRMVVYNKFKYNSESPQGVLSN